MARNLYSAGVIPFGRTSFPPRPRCPGSPDGRVSEVHVEKYGGGSPALCKVPSLNPLQVHRYVTAPSSSFDVGGVRVSFCFGPR